MDGGAAAGPWAGLTEWGSIVAHRRNIDEPLEDFHLCEVQDGLANCAEETAYAWSEASEEQGHADPFVQALLSLTRRCSEHRCASSSSQPVGALGAASRPQPRYQDGRKAKFDGMCRAREETEQALLRTDHDAERQARDLARRENARRRKMQPGWKPKYDAVRGRMFYVHSDSGEVSWEKPLLDEAFDPSVVEQEAFNMPVDQLFPGQELHDKEPVILVLGSETTYAGFAGEDAPRVVFPSIVGQARHQGVMVGMATKDAYVGDEAQSKRGVLSMSYPIHRGCIVNHDKLERLLHHAWYNELRVDPEEHPVLVTVSPRETQKNKERLVQMLFEVFQVPRVFLEHPQTLSLYASGRTTGLVVDIGATQTLCVPVYEGFALPHAITSLDVGGRHVTDYLTKILTERGFSFTSTCERDIVQHLKTRLCYVATDFEGEMSSFRSLGGGNDKTYELPDGNVIVVGNEQFRATEVLFRPSFIGNEGGGIHDCAFRAVTKCDVDIRKDLLANVVLSGGSSFFSGLGYRLKSELSALAPPTMRVDLIQPPERLYSQFIGGSILTSLSSFSAMWINREDYECHGPGAASNPRLRARSPSVAACPQPQSAGHQTRARTPPQQAQEPSLLAQPGSRSTSVATPPHPSLQTLTPLHLHEEQQEQQEQQDHEGWLEAAQAEASKLNPVIDSRPLASSNAFVVHCGKMAAASVQSTTGEPVFCFECSAVLDRMSRCSGRFVDKSELFEWRCAYCGSDNASEDVMPEELPKSDFVDFILEGGPTVAQSDHGGTEGMPSKPGIGTKERLVFAVDISGSMGVTSEVDGRLDLVGGKSLQGLDGLRSQEDAPNQRLPHERSNVKYVSRLQCVQSAILYKLRELAHLPTASQPEVFFVTFNSEVHIRPGAAPATTSIAGDRLGSEDAILQATRGVPCPSPGDSPLGLQAMEAWLLELEESGPTALGPALVAAVELAGATGAGGKVLLCTDGLSNVGVGSIEGYADLSDADQALVDAFYDRQGTRARANGVEVSVVSIEGSSCRLESIGRVADLCGGTVEIVSPLNMMASALASTEDDNPRVATKAQVSLHMGCGWCLVDASAPSGKCAGPQRGSLTATHSQSGGAMHGLQLGSKTVQRHLGNVHQGSDIAMAFVADPDHPSSGTEAQGSGVLPVQVQLYFSHPSTGERRLRVLTIIRPVSDSRAAVEECVDGGVCSLAALHHASLLAQQGYYGEARLALLSTMRLLQRSMCTTENQHSYLDYVVLGERLDLFMRQKEQQESLLCEGAPVAHEPAQATEWNGQAQGAEGSCPKSSIHTPIRERTADRDDDASNAIFQLKHASLESFRAARLQ